MGNNYYARTETQNSDGTPLFAIDYDKSNEHSIIAILENSWGCQIKPFGRLTPIDFYAMRDGRLVGVLELKSRTHNSQQYPTVFLNLRKWLALMMAQFGLAVPGIFVVMFLDGVFYIPISKVDTSKIIIGGTNKLVKSHTDIEPIIEVPIADLVKVQ